MHVSALFLNVIRYHPITTYALYLSFQLCFLVERLVLRQMSDYVTNTATGVLKESVSACRRGHNTTTVMLATRDDIRRAMQRGEVTIAVLADF